MSITAWSLISLFLVGWIGFNYFYGPRFGLPDWFWLTAKTLRGLVKKHNIIVVSIKDALPRAKVKKGDVYKAVIVRTSKDFKRSDGTAIRFDKNAAVLLDKQEEPIATRIFGPVTRELRSKKFMKIISLAPEVL